MPVHTAHKWVGATELLRQSLARPKCHRSSAAGAVNTSATWLTEAASISTSLPSALSLPGLAVTTGFVSAPGSVVTVPSSVRE